MATQIAIKGNGDAVLGATTSSETIRVGIVEDVRPLRDGFRTLIDGTDGFHCTGAFRSMEEALAKIKFDVPNVLLAERIAALPAAARRTSRGDPGRAAPLAANRDRGRGGGPRGSSRAGLL